MLLRQLLDMTKVLGRDISHDFCLMYYKPEQGVERTYFRLYYLSIKLEKLLDIAAYEREKVKKVLVIPQFIDTKFEAILSDIAETKNQLMKIRKFAEGKLISKLSEILPLPAVPLQVVLEKFVEVVDKNPNVCYLWRLEEESHTKYSELEQQFIEENYVALAEIFKAVKSLMLNAVSNAINKELNIDVKSIKALFKDNQDEEGIKKIWLLITTDIYNALPIKSDWMTRLILINVYMMLSRNMNLPRPQIPYVLEDRDSVPIEALIKPLNITKNNQAIREMSFL